MFVGPKGSGVWTQISLLCDKYKLSSMNILETFLQRLTEEKQKWKRARLLAWGFKEPGEPDEDTNQYPPDTEIENDPDDFEKEAHEKEVFKTIFDPSIG